MNNNNMNHLSTWVYNKIEILIGTPCAILSVTAFPAFDLIYAVITAFLTGGAAALSAHLVKVAIKRYFPPKTKQNDQP
jgi:hypothetical protein